MHHNVLDQNVTQTVFRIFALQCFCTQVRCIVQYIYVVTFY
jgi:hypothetical protein